MKKPQAEIPDVQRGFHIMAKPIGPVCNLDCEYCYYTEKHALFPDGETYQMSDEVLEAFIRTYLETQPVPVVEFVWQGGEPTLLGLEFYNKVVRLEQKYAGGKQIRNSLQTNGTRLDEEWCRFLAKYNFLVGLSLDGPKDIHDLYRLDRGGKPTFDRVMTAMSLMKKYNVQFNTLTCVTRDSAYRPLDVYRFLREQGVEFIQFIPIVETRPDPASLELGLKLGLPPVPGGIDSPDRVTPWTVEPEAYGDFLIRVFDEWVRHDVGRVFVMHFEWAVATYLGLEPPACFFTERCGRCVAVEHNGDLFSCDHYVYPDYRLGNVLRCTPAEMINSARQREFGRMKASSLPRYCRECDVLFACRGECPKHRFLKTPDGEPGLNYLCAGYKKYFHHIDRYMRMIVHLLSNNQPVERIMSMIDGPAIIDFGS